MSPIILRVRSKEINDGTIAMPIQPSSRSLLRIAFSGATLAETKHLRQLLDAANPNGFDCEPPRDAGDVPNCVIAIIEPCGDAAFAGQWPNIPRIALVRGDPPNLAVATAPGIWARHALFGLTGTELAQTISLVMRTFTAEAILAQTVESSRLRRFAVFGEISKSLTHEIGNLLALIVAWSTKLKAQIERDADRSSLLGSMEKLDGVSQRMMKLGYGLGLCASGIDDQAERSFDLKETIDLVLDVLQPSLRINALRFECIGAEAGTMVRGNEGRFAQSLAHALLSEINFRTAIPSPPLGMEEQRARGPLRLTLKKVDDSISAFVEGVAVGAVAVERSVDASKP